MTLPVGTYSLYNTFENCPHKAWHTYVLRDIPYVETKERKWGNDVHAALEKRIRNGVALPDTMQAAEPVAAQIANLPHVEIDAELYIGMTAEGRHCPARSSDVWFRGKIDCVVRLETSAWIVDWKTGKVREEPFELETNALLLKCNYPEIENVVANYFWLQQGAPGIRYTCNNHARTFAKLQALRSEMEGYDKAGEWPKRKNPLCGWCDVMACEHNKNQGRK